VGSIHFCANEIVSTKKPKKLEKVLGFVCRNFISTILQTPQIIKNQKPNQSKSIRKRNKEAAMNNGPHSLTHSHDDDANLTSLCFLFFLIVVVSIQKIFFQIFNFFFG